MREVTGAMLWNELSWRPNPHRLGSEVAARPFGLSSAPLRATCPCRPALDDSVHSVRSQPGTVERTEDSCSSPKNHCSTPRADRAHRRPCPDTTPDAHPVTRASATRQIRHESKRDRKSVV